MGRRTIARGAAALILVVAAACSGDDSDSTDGNGAGSSDPPSQDTNAKVSGTDAGSSDFVSTTTPIDAGLPAQCTLPPVTIIAERAGSSPIGSSAFAVTDAIALPIPVVPNPGNTLTAQQTAELATTTDLLGYSLVFADEPIIGGGSDFFQYEPMTAGKLRGLVSIFPAAGVPFVSGDVVTYGTVTGLSIPLPTIGVDLAAFEQPTNSYLGPPAGQVTILGITDDAVCFDVDLTFPLNDPADNTLTIRGVLAGRLVERSTLVMLS